jgi:putative MFS transporter
MQANVDQERNLLARLDRTPLTRRIWSIVAILTLVWLVESFDVGIVGAIVLNLKDTWQLTSGELGLLGACGTAGIVIGLIPAGKLADQYGRRTVLVWGIGLFSVFTLLSGLAWNLPSLVVFRFLAGLGCGAVFPLPYMLISEFVNARRRGAVLGWAQLFLTSGYTLPNLAGIWAGGVFASDLAWRIPLIIGAVPLLFIPLVLIRVPESPRYLLRTGGYAKVRSFVEEVERQAGLPHDESLTPDRPPVAEAASPRLGAALRQLFTPPYLSRSMLSYAALLASFVLWYTMLTYAPSIFSEMGAEKSSALLFTAVMMFIAGFGALLQGYWADRFGRKPVHIGYIVLAGVGLAVLGLDVPIGLVVAGGLLVAFFGLGSFSVSKIYVTEQYPTSLRGTGTATGEMLTRFLAGVVLVSAVPTLILVLGTTALFVVIGVAMVLLVLPMLLYGQETANRSVEETGTGQPEPVVGQAEPAREPQA